MTFSLRTKLSLSFLLIAILVVAVSWTAIASISQMRAIFHDIVFSETKAVELLLEMRNVADKVRIQSVGFRLLSSETAQSEGTKTAEQKYELLANMEKLGELEEAYVKVTEREGERHDESLEKISQVKDRLLAAALAVIETKEQGVVAEQIFSEKRALLEKEQGALENVLSAALADEREDLALHTQLADDYANWARLIGIAGSAAAVVLSIVTGLITAQFIAGPIARLQAAARQIAAGNFSQRISVRSQDEVGELARAFNDMTEKLEASNEKLAGKISELERMNALMVGRELKMIELKKEIERLKTKQ